MLFSFYMSGDALVLFRSCVGNVLVIQAACAFVYFVVPLLNGGNFRTSLTQRSAKTNRSHPHGQGLSGPGAKTCARELASVAPFSLYAPAGWLALRGQTNLKTPAGCSEKARKNKN